jgi:hypothetical protein
MLLRLVELNVQHWLSASRMCLLGPTDSLLPKPICDVQSVFDATPGTDGNVEVSAGPVKCKASYKVANTTNRKGPPFLWVSLNAFDNSIAFLYVCLFLGCSLPVIPSGLVGSGDVEQYALIAAAGTYIGLFDVEACALAVCPHKDTCFLLAATYSSDTVRSSLLLRSIVPRLPFALFLHAAPFPVHTSTASL